MIRVKNEGRAILGLHRETGEPIFEPYRAHRILFAAAGGGKTTCGVVPFLQSTISNKSIALYINDVKEGEIGAQTIDMAKKADRNVAAADEFTILNRPDVTQDMPPYGAMLESHRRAPEEVLFSTETANHIHIEEPEGDKKNAFFREGERGVLEVVQRSLLTKDTRRCRPGTVSRIVNDPDLFEDLLEVSAEEGDDDDPNAVALRGRAKMLLALKEYSPNHFAQFVYGAITATRLWEPGSILEDAGRYSELSYRDLLRESYVFYNIKPQRFIERLGPCNALMINGFLDALLAGEGPCDFVIDEGTNSPVQDFLKATTIMRAYGGRVFFIQQSRSELVRRFGQKLTDTLLENCVIKQWFGFSSPDEAKIVSDAMGESLNIQPSMNQSSENLHFSQGIGFGKEPVMSVNELMALPPNEQIIHIKNVGFFRALKVRQDEIAPYCFDLADNPLEGGRFKPNPKIELVT